MKNVELVRSALLAMQRHSWEQGVAMQALLELGDGDTVIRMAHDAVCRQQPDGRVALVGGGSGVTDPCSVGEALLYAAKATGDPALSAGAVRLLAWAQKGAPRAADGTVFHLLGSRQMWADSLYMLPPFLAAAGDMDGAMRQIDGLWARLYDPSAGLLSARWDEDAGRLIAPEHWGVGNGWALAGMARVLDLLPEEMPAARERLRGRIAGLLDALRPLCLSDGRFRNVVDDPSSFPEVNLSQMAAYTIYRGASRGWLDGALLPWADAMRRAAEESVDAYGLVRGVCGAPRFDAPGIAPEGQAFYLLMEAAQGICFANSR